MDQRRLWVWCFELLTRGLNTGAYYPDENLQGSPLRRLRDQAAQDRNRTKAQARCAAENVEGSCDEYPFASTYEGAFNQTSTSGWSVRGIDDGDNSAGGSLIGAFYQTQRILDRDKFYVQVQKF